MPRVRITGLPKSEVGNSMKKVRITKVPQAKTGNWIKNAVNPAHKGYCTPMTKSTCTPARKAFAKRAKAGKLQAGGELPVTKGLPDDMSHFANVEAEGGEVYQNNRGGFAKIQGDDHEQGGVMIPDAERVLEDTSTKRKDIHSKRLKMSPDEVDKIFGFKPKGPVSHAKAFEQVTAQYGKDIDNYNKKLKNTNQEPILNKASANTIRLNMEHRELVPSKDDVFNTLFEHQEAIKAVHQIPDDGGRKYGGFKPKYQAGGDSDNIDLGLYKGPKNPANALTPTGKTSEARYSDKQIADAYKAAGVDFGSARGPALQEKIYNYLIENQPDVLKATLKEYGATKKALGAKKGNLKAFSDPDNATKEDLQAALPYLKDGLLGARIPLPSVDNQSQTTFAPQPKQKQQFNPRPDPSVNINPQFHNQPINDYHEATNWYDIAPGTAEYLDSLTREPELYNPVKLHQLKYKLLNPTAALYANQGDYNAALSTLQRQNLGSGVAAANLSNLTAQKYKANNQILGEYENANVGIQNREIDYNTGVRDRQSLADAKSRESFYDNVLKSRDNQRLQKLQAIQDISRAQQLKARQNSSLNLISKLSPAFDEQGNYNGYQYIATLPPDIGYAPYETTPAPKTKSSQRVTYKVGDRTITTTTNQ